VWDDRNLAHLAKHGVTRAEVKAVVRAPHVQSAGDEPRILVVGPAGGRIIAVAPGPVPDAPGAFSPFRALPASRQERRHDHDQQGRASA